MPSIPSAVIAAGAAAGLAAALLAGGGRGALARPTPSPARPPAAGADSAAEALVERALARLSLRQRAAQMVMPWVPGELEPGTPEFRRAAHWAAAGVGGLIVGKGDGDQTARSLALLQREAGVPLLMASDLEWGAGMRLLGATLLPVAMAVAATGDTALAYAHGRATAEEGRAAGLHAALAPALDVNVNPQNPIINTRSFGADPAAVARMGAATVRGLQDGGLLAVVKHFPGHGDTDQDSHLTLPVIRASRARLDSVELVPFRAAVRAGAGGVMVGHIAVPALTGTRVPASLSPAVMGTVLRRELGFGGLAFTDALNMAGVARVGSSREVALRAVRAGADVLLQPPDADGAIDAIAGAVARGEISRERLDASVRRILRAKARAGLLDAAHAGDDAGARLPVRRGAPMEPGAVASAIAERSITLLRDSGALLPLDVERPLLSLVYSNAGVPGGPSTVLDSALRAHGVRLERRTLSAPTAGRLADSLVGAWDGGETLPVVLVATYTQAVPWRGALGLPPALAEALERIARRAPLVHVALGDPYVVASTPSASTVMLGWSGLPAAQLATARALLGAAPLTGRLPVPIPPRYPLGHGVARPAGTGPR